MQRPAPMLRSLFVSLLFLLGAGGLVTAQDEAAPVHLKLAAHLFPERHAVDVVIEITGAPLVDGVATFRLDRALSVGSLDPEIELSADLAEETAATGSGETGGPLAVRKWHVRRRGGGPLAADTLIRLKYQGVIHHPLESEGQEYARSFATTSGTIGEEGIMLSGGSWWVPTFDDRLMTFEMLVDVPRGWDSVSQGGRTLHEEREIEGDPRRIAVWECKHPMEEIYLIAARFHEYWRNTGNVAALAFLREEDEALANRYLDVTSQYIEMYRHLIGPYPFEKFALVENFWETGYGMPSFTLLGSTVIRLPFILHSSYPHEILHNWWGNGVYVDWESGNWCEGLTAYLADHLIKEGRGEGITYRRDTLDKYRSYVSGEKDFPLTAFRSRHSSSTEAVGYGKSLMLWHMLRRKIGDQQFSQFLSQFYSKNRFRRASFGDMEKVASAVAGQDLAPFFAQWVERTGAPYVEATFAPDATGVTLTLRQTQDGPPYELVLPVAITRRGAVDAEMATVALTGREAEVRFEGTPPVVRLDVDPYFDVFRRLHREEIPPTLAGIFGSERVTVIVPTAEQDPLADAWQAFAEGWRADQTEGFEVVGADAIEGLPADRSVWILGRGNPWREVLTAPLAARGVAAPPAGTDCFVYALRHPANPDLGVGWVGGGTAAALPGLARKLPHYGKYSFLGFTGDEPTNNAKGQWGASASPLVWAKDAGVKGADLRPREPLATLPPVYDPKELLAHVEFLADLDREGRGVGTLGLREAEEYIAQAFAEAGLEAGAPGGGYFQVWQEPDGPKKGRPARLANVIAYLPGRNPEFTGQSVVVGAHFDHLGKGWPDVHAGDEGQVHAGADDNASGVAVLIELARHLGRGHKPERTIVFVAFGGEEWGLKGSRHYLETMKQWPAEKVHSMVNLDTVGRLEGKPLTLFGTGTATEWMHFAFGVGFGTGVKYTLIADDPGGSDQVSFHAAHIPAVQLFSGVHADYHRPSDTMDKVDGEGLVSVLAFTKELVIALADWPTPFTTSFAGAPPPTTTAGGDAAGGRRVSLGTVPDFAFSGPGYRASSITPGSAADEAGLLTGDVLLAIDGVVIENMRGYSDILKTKSPGDRIRIRFRRAGTETEVVATLRAR